MFFVSAGVFGVVSVRAAIQYGGGYYLNLCGSGTTADQYTCNSGCNSSTGLCTSNNNGVVRWVCSGKWNQCQERESAWSNSEALGSPGCGKTVQISLFDKKCRQTDGRWNQDCNLLGYMVWYSGDCYLQPQITPSYSASPSAIPVVSITIKPTVTPIPSPTLKPTATPRPTATPTLIPGVPTVTVVPTISPTPTVFIGSDLDVCGRPCKKRADCPAGFSCFWGECRNPSCVEDRGCFCDGSSSTESAVAKSNPETGMPIWLGGVFLISLFVVGGVMRRTAKKVW
jgi:hypothetical protein